MGILSFFGQFSIKQYLYAGIAIAAVALLTKGVGMADAHFTRVNNLEQANKELEVQKTAMTIEKLENEAALIALENEKLRNKEALDKINKEFNEIRDTRETQLRVLEGGRLGRAASEKTSLIEKKANAATQKIFEDFEEVINND